MKTKAKNKIIAFLMMVIIAVSLIFTVNITLSSSAATAAGFMEIPQITVLTHGLGSGASYWSNDGKGGSTFAYDEDSLVAKLSKNAGGAYIYRAKTEGGSGNPKYTLYEAYEDDNNTIVNKINNVSKHIIIVFDSESKSASNAAVYSEFKKMLNGVIKDVQALNPNKLLPKVNLIGHSRGGITNLLYTLDYPQYVDSLISIGTPYFGPEAVEDVGKIILGDTEGFKDLNNESLYNGYYDRWIRGYESKYKNINSIAIGGATEVSYLRKVLEKSSKDYAAALASLLQCFENAVFQMFTVPYLKSSYPDLVSKYPALSKFGEELFVEMVTLLNNEIHFGLWYSDVLVPVDSQQGVKDGKNYYFTKYVKEFSESNSPLEPKLATNNIPVIHNIETYDADIHNYILNNIILKSGDSISTEISNVNKIENGSGSMLNLVWQIKIRNTHKQTRTYAYNTKMCNLDDAQNWTNLKDIEVFRLEPGDTKIVNIESNGLATSIAISSTYGNKRYIKYADNLWFQSNVMYDDNIYKMTVYDNTIPYNTYYGYSMKVGIVCKKGDTWVLELTNNSGSERSFWYNRRMCYFGDAQNWTTLSDIEQTEKIAAGDTTFIEIQEYGTATSIALSYINGSTRYIFYANNLNAAGTMSSYSNTKAYNSYTKNGMTVSIAGNKNGTWLIELTNNTGSGRTFEYNYKMCYAGDAEKWTGLSHPASVYLADGETTSKPLQISENGAATSIAISYMDGNIRKIFYAKNLNVAGTMTAYESTVDPSASSGGECVAEGTLITLADGSQKAVEELTGNELLLVWNLQTGSLDYAPILFIDSEQIGHYEVIKLSFSDGTAVDVISEHGFWDTDLNEYVYLDKYAADYIGHSFLKQDGSGMTEVVLTGVEISTEVTTAYSPVTYGHLCYYVNGMLSMPGGIEGLFNIFEVDGETMAYNAEAMAADIEQYGLFTYEEFNELVPVTEEMFESVNGQYLKVAIGKGLITVEQISGLVERYSQFF